VLEQLLIVALWKVCISDTVYRETLMLLKFGEFSISTFWWNKVWRTIQAIKTPLILIRSQLCTLQQNNNGAYIRNIL